MGQFHAITSGKPREARGTEPVCDALDMIIMTATGPGGRPIPDPGAPVPV